MALNWGAPQDFVVPLQYLQNGFKFGTQLAFAKAHHKITPREKVGVALG